MLTDPDLAAIRAYGIEHEGKDIARPSTFIVQPPEAKISWIYVGDRAGDRPLLDLTLEQLGTAPPAVAYAQ